MHLTLIPFRGLPGQPETVLEVMGDTLIIDGQPFPLAAIPEGGEATSSGDGGLFAGPIRRVDGIIHAVLRVRLGNTAAPEQPENWVLDARDGPVTIPALRHPTEVEE